MKTRIIRTDIFCDEAMLQLETQSRMIAVYLYCNKHIGLTNLYKLPIGYIQIETGYDISSIKLSLDKLQEVGIIKHKDYFWLQLCRKDFAALQYSGKFNDIAIEKYISEIPKEIKAYFNIDSSIDSSIDTNDKQEIINNKSKTINKKQELGKSFNLFWEEYPKKVNKVTALKSFEKLNPDKHLLDVIIKGIAFFKETKEWKKDDGQFIPYPTTWLNNKRWEDEITKTKNWR